MFTRGRQVKNPVHMWQHSQLSGPSIHTKCLTWVQFHQNFTCNFFSHRSQKCKKDSQLKQLFALLGSVQVKAGHKHIDEIETWMSTSCQPKVGNWQVLHINVYSVRTTFSQKNEWDGITMRKPCPVFPSLLFWFGFLLWCCKNLFSETGIPRDIICKEFPNNIRGGIRGFDHSWAREWAERKTKKTHFFSDKYVRLFFT